jgi:hypothetical protein
MQKFQLELLLHIIGIGSASGLFYNNGTIYLIADNSHLLYEYNMEAKTLNTTKLVKDTYKPNLENVNKKEKPDYEAMAAYGNDLYIFGSGSTDLRKNIAHVNLSVKRLQPYIDATELYQTMMEFGEIKPEDFNIEAAVNDGTIWYLFNRGNGPARQNGVFTLDGEIEEGAFQIVYNPVALPDINGAPSGFTDAVLADGKLYFIASAEKTDSTYADGEVAGTLVGRMDTESMEVEFTEVISTKNKFEGITLYKNNAGTLEFLLCEDTDSDAGESDIYRLTLEK